MLCYPFPFHRAIEQDIHNSFIYITKYISTAYLAQGLGVTQELGAIEGFADAQQIGSARIYN